MNKNFRTEPVVIDGETINLEFKPVQELFCDGDAPYLAVGQTGGGKTTMCIDIIYKYAKTAAKIYYVTMTEPKAGDTAIQNIPTVFRIKPSFQNLYAIWKEIKAGAEQMTMTADQMLGLLSNIYPVEESKQVITTYHEEMKRVEQELQTKYHNLPSLDASRKVMDEKDIVAVEVLTRLILSGINIYGTSKLSQNQMSMVQTLLSTEQKTILLIDDVTAELNNMKSSTKQVMFATDDQEVSMREGRAMELLLTDIFTKARHYDTILVLFVHTWNTINVKQQLKNFIIIDEGSAEGVKGLRTVGTTRSKALIRIASNKIFANKYPHHVVVVKDSQVYITKADLHTGEPIEFDELNQHLIDACNNLMTGLDYIPSNSALIKDNSASVDHPASELIDDIESLII